MIGRNFDFDLEHAVESGNEKWKQVLSTKEESKFEHFHYVELADYRFLKRTIRITGIVNDVQVGLVSES